ncbi:hypothetical protein N7478_000167 [Penicillium angulare]|uniref:uncharacterized protein n=1 Tax=Penicillium angulare TaxID=116970 RepID=UPI00254083DB|nr:uncharacterized protein N7478_000167 [Penicillium angulare]KAJ5290916.1 hypothetical protein N7478_000167 [Penicillium angulare]
MPPVIISMHYNEMMLPPFVGMAPFLIRDTRPRPPSTDTNPGPVKGLLMTTREICINLYEIAVLLKDIIVLSGEIIIKAGEVIVAAIDLCEVILGPDPPGPRRDNVPTRRRDPPPRPILRGRRNSSHIEQVQTVQTTTTTAVVDVDDDRIRRGRIFHVDSDERV